MVPSERTVTVGVGHGKKAARCIDKWLNLDATPRDPKHPLVHLDQMNLWYFGGHTRRIQPEQAPETRVSDFGEIVAGLSPKEAEFEARRCLSAATVPAPRMPSSNSAPATGTASTTNAAPAAPPATSSVPCMPSR